jgi:hypothetical protein
MGMGAWARREWPSTSPPSTRSLDGEIRTGALESGPQPASVIARQSGCRPSHAHVLLRTKHALTHEVAYASVLQEQRRTLHARLVDAIEAGAGDRLDEQVERLAHHAVHGERWERAVLYLMPSPPGRPCGLVGPPAMGGCAGPTWHGSRPGVD